ncbi:helix-turn-helix domain-containing protein [Streptomyces montanisoli]|uniref:Helix-turn-helix domain-containing protein n=1 Tax=Streptomyces montanisoli TaxID=2798581 RepID=A0A940MJ55_9ACTN|nr:helix-turn-helix transcriptional regulator [Streptomyces montanisoli]MBP0459498.1 helix-turn-helix domain-containing protein [Streptomyces montanisoli]
MSESAVVDDEGVPGGEADREPDPSDSLRTFGAVLRALREHAGYSRTEFADLVCFSRHTVESVELGRRMPDMTLVERSEEALGNTGALRRSSKYVTRGRGDVGLAAWFKQWARLERVAVSLCTYECRLVPGVLQSEGYARALFENRLPLLTDERLEAQIEARLERQKMLRERPTVPFHFIVEEAVFRRRLGGLDVLRAQLNHVLELTAPRNVTLQIMPTEAEFHACMDGPVQLLETPEGRRLAYSEGQENGRLISDRKGVRLLYQRYDTLRSQALNTKDSRGLLERLRGEL